MPAYLDHAASTPMRPEAVEAMLPYLTESYANPSGAHRAARDARKAIDEARDVVAEALGMRPGEVVFTAGGTEADNLAVFGVQRRRSGVVICSAIEHPGVAGPVASIGGRTVPVDGRGVLDLAALESVLIDEVDVGEPVALVSLMAVNNEVGTIQPLAEAAEIVWAYAPNAALHTDAVQAVPWIDVAARTDGFDLVSISAHKFGGPKGVGALAVRDGVDLAPLIMGGGQERERRSGTQNVAGIVAMATALALTADERNATVERVAAQRDRLADELVAQVPGLEETGIATAPGAAVDRSHKVAGSCHVCIDGVESESLLFLLEADDVYASAASSCASGAMEPSPVLAAMGISREAARGALRLSLGTDTSDDDVDAAVASVKRAVEQLRRFS